MRKQNFLMRKVSILFMILFLISACVPNPLQVASTPLENNNETETWNHYRITYSISLDGFRGITTVWMPFPVDGLTQQNIKLISVTPTPKDIFYESHGNGIIYWEEDIQNDGVEFKEVIDLYLMNKEWNIDPEMVGNYDPNDPVPFQYLQPSSMIQIDEPEIIAMAQEIIGEETNPYKKVLLIIDYMKNYFNIGVSDSQDALTAIQTKIDSGCGSIAFSFVALCRAAGVPARVMTGVHSLHEGTFNWKENNFGTHLWAEFYLPNYGWIPVDPLWPDGTIIAKSEGNRIVLSRDSDINIGYGHEPIPWFHMPYVNDSQEENSALILKVEFLGSESSPGY